MPSVLITGASDGIGRALVDDYAQRGWQVFGTGRRQRELLSPPLPDDCTYISADLTQSQNGLDDALPAKLDVAILNAGLGKVGAPQAHTDHDIERIVAVNTTAPLLLAQQLLPRLEGGTLVFVGSTAARGSQPDFSVYAASKAALVGAQRALSLEWDGRVNVLLIHPGPTATGMHDKAGLPDIALRRFFTSPPRVARAMANQIARGRNARFGLFFTLRHALARRS